jgi:Phage tail sheath C-terminal domain
MALTSPGVEVTIIDQSQYLPAAAGSVPLVVLATAQNKANPTGTGVAPATTAANANKLYQVTSQRDLVSLYGTPFFYTTTAGTPIQGYELNEYGLLAAYSLLGVTNRCYVLRADVDLASLVGQTARPTGAPANGAYWLDTLKSTWGINTFNQTTGQFTTVTPIVISDYAALTSDYPLDSIGTIGSYAVNATISGTDSPISAPQFFYKNYLNTWVKLGSQEWLQSVPTVQGTASNPTLTYNDSFNISVSGIFNVKIIVPNSPDNNVAGIASAINSIGLECLSARVSSGKLIINSAQNFTTGYLAFSNVTGNPLTALGITPSENYYQPLLQYGTSSQMPLWSTSQTTPRPTGSVWMKVGSSGSGLVPSVSRYSTTTASWTAKNVGLATSDWSVNATLDPTGGALVAAGEVYAQYNYDNQFAAGPVFLWERAAAGSTVATGTTTDVTFTSLVTSPATVNVQVSVPGSTNLAYFAFTINDGDTGTDFVTAFLGAAIPNTTALITTDGAIQLVHTKGGVIILDDIIQTAGANQGFSAGVLDQAGFMANTTPFTKDGPAIRTIFQNLTPAAHTGSGTGATVNVVSLYGQYVLQGDGIQANGSGYAIGDTLTLHGSQLGGTTGVNDLVVKITAISGGGGTGPAVAASIISGTASVNYGVQCSNWVALSFTPNEGAPVANPANGTNWFYSVIDQVDIMVQANGEWKGYRNVNYDSTGFPSATGSNSTDPNGPIISATEPTTQSDGTTALSYGDLWINTTDLEMYPVISRWESVSGVDMWVLIDNADQTSSKGVAFYDARWSSSGAINPVNDPIPTIKSLLTSNYIDLDAPNPAAYPTGMLLFNTRRSGYNVKKFTTSYFTSMNYPNAGAYDAGDPTNTANLPEFSYTWVSESGLQSNGAPYMGRQAQRAVVVKSLRAAIDTNTDIRDEDNFFNLMATPNYPELQPNMVVLNADRGETGYIIGDTPMRLAPNATDIQAWATNAAGATSTGEAGCVTRNTYLGLFYPSGITSDLSGNLVAVPPSHMMLRTFLKNDTISYPWLAAAGTRRGIIDNATNIGYVNSTTGEFVTTKTQIGIRDVLYINFINPLVFFTGVGLLNYGNKTSYNSSSALDRTNVARLIAYVRRQLTLAARPFVFEPNDALTRNQIAGVVQTLMVDLVAKRGIYDYLVICDESNNTPARIDRNELWIDVALEPVKAAEFIYIPVRVLNTGEIKGL